MGLGYSRGISFNQSFRDALTSWDVEPLRWSTLNRRMLRPTARPWGALAAVRSLLGCQAMAGCKGRMHKGITAHGAIHGDMEAPHSMEVGTDQWEEITAMLQVCWHSDAARRPPMKEVSTWLSNSTAT